LPETRQNLLFAATMPDELRRLAEQVLQEPAVAELAHSAPPAVIEHALCGVQQKRKLALLRYLLSDGDFVSAIVFTRTKHRARKLALQLGKKGHKAVALQGNMSQAQRDHAMQGFRGRRFDILVATDIAARGIDVDRVSHVINFDVPDSPEAYTHRIGRTGRTERTGKACTFVTEDDRNVVRVIERTMGTSIPRLMIDGFEGTFSVPPTRQQRPIVGGYPKKGTARRHNKRRPRGVRRLRRRK
jgi:ATP-dependent RNA helicase RhlE